MSKTKVARPADASGSAPTLRVSSALASNVLEQPDAGGHTSGALASGKHVPALDGIRGLAIGMVLAVHFVGDTQAYSAFERVMVKLGNFGTYGVSLFFVLSGYLITGILIDAKGQSHYFRNFYVRRALRIFPLYYGVLALGLWLWPRAWSPVELEVTRDRQIWLWAYVSNFLVALEQRWDALPYFSHFWSLSVEEHFYFLWPFLVARSGARSLAQWAIGLSVLALSLRVGLAAAGTDGIVAYTITPAKLDGLCLGGLLAIWVRRPDGLAQLARWAPRLSLAVLAYLFLGHVVSRQISPTAHAIYFEGRETGIVLLFAALLVSVLRAPRDSLLARFFTSRPMVTLGKYSYGLYVFHAFISWYLYRARTEDALASVVGSHTLAVFIQAVVGVAASLAVAFVSYHGFEKRFLALKSRFEAERRELVAG